VADQTPDEQPPRLTREQRERAQNEARARQQQSKKGGDKKGGDKKGKKDGRQEPRPPAAGEDWTPEERLAALEERQRRLDAEIKQLQEEQGPESGGDEPPSGNRR